MVEPGAARGVEAIPVTLADSRDRQRDAARALLAPVSAWFIGAK